MDEKFALRFLKSVNISRILSIIMTAFILIYHYYFFIPGSGHSTQQRPKGPQDRAQIPGYLPEAPCQGKEKELVHIGIRIGFLILLTREPRFLSDDI